jgi:hypothetical protein
VRVCVCVCMYVCVFVSVRRFLIRHFEVSVEVKLDTQRHLSEYHIRVKKTFDSRTRLFSSVALLLEGHKA